MTNIFKKLGVGIVDFAKWLAGAVQETAHLSAKIQQILKAAQPLEAPFVAGLSSIVADVEALIAASTAAVSANGLNFPADSKAYEQFLNLIADFRKMVPIAAQAIQILEGKTPPAPTASIK